MEKKGNILISDVIFLVLTIAFISILFIFISRQSSSVSLLEEKSAKEIALIIDSAESETQITLDMSEVLEKAKDKKIIEINNEQNFVFVKLSEKSGYQYGFFNDNFVESEINEGGYLTLKIK